ncbi:MAG TPA: PH domain-containing protein [Tepidisphaeraceae bacterium]|jgi:hypothetical protein|nr:PH domain-containing protein [Tepidisphaeraceae bacterium]
MPDSNITPRTEPPSSPLSANLPHRPADDTEEVYYDGSPLIRGAVGKAFWWEFLGLALIAIPPVTRFVFERHLPAGYMAASAFLGLSLVCLPPLRAKTIRYRVTNYRIDYERGFIGKDIDTLELWHVEDIQFHQTYRDRLLAMGTITVISHDLTTPRLVMHSLPNSRHLFDQLKQRIIAVKRQRGVLKVDSGS